MTVIDHTHLSLPQLAYWGDGAWREQAKCKGQPVDDFFPDRVEDNDMALQVARAKMFCVQCPVRFDCLMFAVANNLLYGCYGGIGPTDRRNMTIDNITPQDAMIPLKSLAYHVRKLMINKDVPKHRRKSPDPVPRMAELLGTTEEWVRDTLKNAPDYLV